MQHNSISEGYHEGCYAMVTMIVTIALVKVYT